MPSKPIKLGRIYNSLCSLSLSLTLARSLSLSTVSFRTRVISNRPTTMPTIRTVAAVAALSFLPGLGLAQAVTDNSTSSDTTVSSSQCTNFLPSFAACVCFLLTLALVLVTDWREFVCFGFAQPPSPFFYPDLF